MARDGSDPVQEREHDMCPSPAHTLGPLFKEDVKIFIGLGDICGYYSQLERGLKNQGVSCVLVNAYPSREYPRDHRPGVLGRVVEWIAQMRVKCRRGSVQRRFWEILQGLSMFLLFIYTLFVYDAYVFSGGVTFFWRYDLRLLRILRKKIIVVFHGSDSRPPYINGAVVGTHGSFDVEECVRETRKIKSLIREVERSSDITVNHSMASHLHENKIVSWLSIGVPCDCTDDLKVHSKPDRESQPCVIVHAPTRPGPKGSDQIENAIDSLRAKGLSIEFIKLIERPNSDVLSAISRCDFVVDELFSDTTMASLASEAAVLGKPAIVGMYGYETLQKYTEHYMIPPALVCQPGEIEVSIEKLVLDKEFRLALGLQARRFVEQQWSAEEVAKRFIRLLTEDVPDEWWFDPKSIDYLCGWGLTERRVKEVIRTIVDSYGVAALHLSDKPHLEQAFMEFACKDDL